MNGNLDLPNEVPPQAGSRPWLAIASLVLGILAFVLSLFVIGGLLGFMGVILGVIHLRRKRGSNAMARWGIGLSIASIVFSVGLGVLYYQGYKKVRAAMASGSAAGADVQQWKGVLAPDFTVKTLEGQTFQLSQLRGKRVVVDLWATWCPPCVKEIPHFIQLFKETPGDQLLIVGISSEDEKKLKTFVKKHAVNYPIASAKDLPSPYKDARSIPTTFFIDRNGVIQSVAVGYHDFAAIKSYALADDVQGEPKAPPAPATTVP